MADDQSFFNNRGQLEESLYATAKLLETLDKNNRLEEASEVNFLLAGMEGLIGQFSENQFDMQHEIQEMLESSRQGLLTHEKLVEMIMGEQVRSQYLNSIVGSLRDQIENLFNTIVNKEDDLDEASSQDFIDKVSSNVSLMWKQVDSMSKVISSPTKKLDQTIRKIDSEVVVHLNKSLHTTQDKRDNFAEKIDKQLEKVKAKTPTMASKLKVVEETVTKSKNIDQDDDNNTFQTGVPNINRKGVSPPLKPRKKTAEDYMNDLENELELDVGKGSAHHTPLTSARIAPTASHVEHNTHTADTTHLRTVTDENDSQSLEELLVDELIAHDDDDNDYDIDIAHTGIHGSSKGHKKKKTAKGKHSVTGNNTGSTPSNNGGRKTTKNKTATESNGGNRRRSFDKPGNVCLSATNSRDEYDSPASASGGGLTIGSRVAPTVAAAAAAAAGGGSAVAGNSNSASIYANRMQSQLVSASLAPINTSTNASSSNVTAANADLVAASLLNNANNTNRPVSHTEAERQSTLEAESPSHRRRSITSAKNNEDPQTKLVDDEISLGSKKPSTAIDSSGWPQKREDFIKAMQEKEKELQAKTDDIDRIVREKLLQAMRVGSLDTSSAAANKSSGKTAADNNIAEASSQGPNMNELQQKLQLLLQQTGNTGTNQMPMNNNLPASSSALIMSDDTPTSRTLDSSHHNLRSSLNNLPSLMSDGLANDDNDQNNDDDESSQHDHAIRALSRSLQLSGSTNLDPQQIMLFLSQQVKALERGDVTFKVDVANDRRLSAADQPSSSGKQGGGPKSNTRNSADATSRPTHKGSGKTTNNSNPLDTIKRRLSSHLDGEQHAEQVDDLLQTILFNASKSGGKAPDWERIKIGLPSKKASTVEIAINTDQSMNNMLGHPQLQYHSPQHHGIGVTGAFPAHHGTVLPTSTTGGGLAYAAASTSAASPLPGGIMSVDKMSLPSLQQPSYPPNARGSLLPIHDNQQDLLITRTYRMPPEKEHFMHLLHNSPDPLLFIYKECKSMLSKDVQAKLLRLCAPLLDSGRNNNNNDNNDHTAAAATLDEELSKQRWLTVAALHWEQVQVLEQEIQGITIVISDLETISQDAIMIVKAARKGGKIGAATVRNSFTITDQNVNLMESHLFDVNRLMGELEARLLAANLQQLEHRSLFQSLQAKGIKELPSLCRSIPDLKKSFDTAQSNQGLLYEIQQRLLLCRDRCKRYDLFKYLPYHNEGTGGGNMMSANESFSRHASSSFLPALTLEPPRVKLPQHAMMNADVEAVLFDQQEQIKQLTEEVEDLEMELLELVKERDHTPDAILFYSLLHDPAYVSNLQQLCLQLKNVRGFLDYSVHMDYQTLRKRLSVCMVLIPNVEKLIETYGLQYKRWSKFRQNWFAERNLRGGSAEGLATCPLCYKSLKEEEEKPNDHDHGSADHNKHKGSKPRKKHNHAHTIAASVSALDPDLFGTANNSSSNSKGKSDNQLRFPSSLKFPPPQKQQQQQQQQQQLQQQQVQTRQQKIEDIPQINLTASIKAIRDRS